MAQVVDNLKSPKAPTRLNEGDFVRIVSTDVDKEFLCRVTQTSAGKLQLVEFQTANRMRSETFPHGFSVSEIPRLLERIEVLEVIPSGDVKITLERM